MSHFREPRCFFATRHFGSHNHIAVLLLKQGCSWIFQVKLISLSAKKNTCVPFKLPLIPFSKTRYQFSCAHVKSFLLPAGDNIILLFSPVSFFGASKSIKIFLSKLKLWKFSNESKIFLNYIKTYSIFGQCNSIHVKRTQYDAVSY